MHTPERANTTPKIRKTRGWIYTIPGTRLLLHAFEAAHGPTKDGYEVDNLSLILCASITALVHITLMQISTTQLYLSHGDNVLSVSWWREIRWQACFCCHGVPKGRNDHVTKRTQSKCSLKVTCVNNRSSRPDMWKHNLFVSTSMGSTLLRRC